MVAEALDHEITRGVRSEVSVDRTGSMVEEETGGVAFSSVLLAWSQWQ